MSLSKASISPISYFPPTPQYNSLVLYSMCTVSISTMHVDEGAMSRKKIWTKLSAKKIRANTHDPSNRKAIVH